MKVYGRKQNCQFCTATKAYLDMNNVEYEFIDVDENEDAKEYVKGLGFMSLPVVETEDDVWSGFDPARLSKYV